MSIQTLCPTAASLRFFVDSMSHLPLRQVNGVVRERKAHVVALLAAVPRPDIGLV